MNQFKSGFISIIGRPNAGKSTILNAIFKEKRAITSRKAQTTRDNIVGILNHEKYQMIFVDTPGIHEGKTQLSKNMNRGALNSMQDCDVIYYVVDGGKRNFYDETLINYIKQANTKVFLILNKIDMLNKSQLIDKLVYYEKQADFDEIIPISALKSDNINALIETTYQALTQNILFYPSDMSEERDQYFKVRELIRETVLEYLHEEIPHAVAVVLEQFQTTNQRVDIDAIIVVERTSQKSIVIGKSGQMIKTITLKAQQEIQKQLNSKVNLNLYVRVEKNWRNQQTQLLKLGYLDQNE